MTIINNVAGLWWSWMGNMLWQASLFILIVSVIDLFIRKWVWPQVRYAVWLLILLKLIIPPTWSLPSSFFSRLNAPIHLTLVQNNADISGESANIAGENPPVLKHPDNPTATPFSPPLTLSSVAQPVSRLSLSSIAMLIWIVGILAFLAILIGKMMRLRRWHQQQEERMIPQWFHELMVRTADQIGLQRLPSIVFSDKAVTPAVYGVFRPVLLLPINYVNRLSSQDARHILLHELCHLKRGDLWLHALCLFLQVIYWFNPLLIWTRRQTKHVREICCDLTVSSILRDQTPGYRQTLLDTARSMLTESLEPGLGLLGVFEEPFRLVTRLRWLAKETWQNRPLKLAGAAIVSLFLILTVLPMAGLADEPVSGSSDIQPSKTAQFLSKGGKYLRSFTRSKTSNPDYRYHFTFGQLPAFTAVVLPMHGPLDQLNSATGRLQNYLRSRNIDPVGPIFIQSFCNSRISAPAVELYWEVGYPVPSDTRAETPFIIKEYPVQEVSSLKVQDMFDDDLINWEWANWLLDNHCQTTDAAFIFCPDQLYQSHSKRLEWEIHLPVKKIHEDYPDVEIHTQFTLPQIQVVLPMKGSFDQEASAFKGIKDYTNQQNIRVDGAFFIRYYTDSTLSAFEEDDMIWEVGVPVEKGSSAVSPYQIRYEPEQLIAFTTVECDKVDLIRYVYAFAFSYIREGYLPIGYGGIEILDGDISGKATRKIWCPVRRMQQNPNRLPVF